MRRARPSAGRAGDGGDDDFISNDPEELEMSFDTARRCRGMRTAILLAVLLLSAQAARAQSPTFARTDYPSLANAQVFADFNGDGRLDVAGIINQGVAVMAGNGDGTFGAPVAYALGRQVQNLATGDFTGDAILDLVVTISDPAFSFVLVRGVGNGTFDAAGATLFPNAAGADAPSVAATDLDNDGDLDVVIGHQIACWTAPCVVRERLSVLLGRGDGTFDPARVSELQTWAAAIAVGNFNGDAFRDLAIASHDARVQVLLGNGNGTFTARPFITVATDTFGVEGNDIDVADVDRDGIQDLVAAFPTQGSRTAVLRGLGNGDFGPPLVLQDPNQANPNHTAVADFNGDTFADLGICLGNGTFGLLAIRNGNGGGGFGSPVYHQIPPDRSSVGCIALTAVDLNGDGKPDLAMNTGGALSATVFAVLRNTTGTAPPPSPSAPSLVSPANDAIVNQPVTLDWSDVTGAISYQVQVDNSSTIASPFVANTTVSASQVTLSGLPAQRLWWRVRARNSAGVFGPFSSVRRFTPRASTAPASLSAVSVNPASVAGGSGSTGTVTLTAAAPTGGAAISLSSSSGAATVPGSVTIPAGATSVAFQISTAIVTTSTAVTISGAYNGVTRSATLTVAPQTPTTTATLTVTATGRSGERITSSPAGINVSVGSTGSASFATGTSITLSVSNGREAIWSGACSSGGNKRRTCTFTLNANAAVTANVQ
jgi:hypothetical protein